MRHDANDREESAARFVGGDLRPRAHRAFERHLLECEDCWREVELGRAGRALAESAREVAPADLRDRLRAVIQDESASALPLPLVRPSRPVRPRTTWQRPVALAAVAVTVLAGALVLRPESPGPTAVAAAVADFRAQRLPGTTMPPAPAPDLSAVRLHASGAAAGVVGGRPVTAYAYRDDAGRDVLVYQSRDPFPRAASAVSLTSADGPWIDQVDGVTVLCARSPHALLVLGRDRTLVLAAARALDVT